MEVIEMNDRQVSIGPWVLAGTTLTITVIVLAFVMLCCCGGCIGFLLV